MTQAALLAIDQGTSSSRAIAFAANGAVLESAQTPFEQIYPQAGWVEHDPEVLWATVLSATRAVLEKLRARGIAVAAIGVTNQRETTIAWNRRTGVPLYNAIVWQDRRTAPLCRELEAAGVAPALTAKTGLRLDPYFSATKMNWILEHVPEARSAAQRGDLLFGTVDAFLIWRLTAGRCHVTDATNASRTALFDVVKNRWDEELCATFAVAPQSLPHVLDCTADFGSTDPGVLGISLPIRGVAGDQQAALIGQAGLAAGDVKSTYGTGAFLMLNTGDILVRSQNRLLSTIAYRLNGRSTYALEGSILSAGATIQWLRDGLGLVTSAADVEALAGSVIDTGGVYLVPAFTGLGAPYWDPEARGAILGLTRATERGQIVRAGLDSVVYQTRDLLDAMAADGVAPGLLKVDGGMARNGLFLQRLADILGVPIRRPKVAEATAWGAACLAGLGCGMFNSTEDLVRLWSADADFEPRLAAHTRGEQIRDWHRAVRRVLGGGEPNAIFGKTNG
ncbi:MAG: glycerol kinase GlpK [Steroidobacteraceae bacterium]